MKIVDASHPFFKPLWRRIAVVAVTLGWAVVEFVSGGPIWGFIFAAIGAWCAWEFFVSAPGTKDTDERQD
ncbi:hypothetical protein [Amaricoccus macauensis]|uniref:hypothetical protein n=1 Tax=Amaricoccus macauensis TaxID=57001 RepID=UPI003C7ED323